MKNNYLERIKSVEKAVADIKNRLNILEHPPKYKRGDTVTFKPWVFDYTKNEYANGTETRGIIMSSETGEFHVPFGGWSHNIITTMYNVYSASNNDTCAIYEEQITGLTPPSMKIIKDDPEEEKENV